MKKVLTMVLVAITSVFLINILISANDAGTADVVIHFQTWEGEYDNIGPHTWGAIGAKTAHEYGTDDFGLFSKFTNVPLNVNEGIGLKYATGIYSDGKFEATWESEFTKNVIIDKKDLIKDQVNHIYIFEGAATSEGNPAYQVAKNDQANLLVMYADPSGVYEDNLGVHAWEGWTGVAPDWAEPAKIFTNGASHGAVPVIKVAMLHTTNINAGFLIYAGGDNNKKTGDVTIKDAFGLEADDKLPIGEVGFAYIYSKGNAYTENDNVTYGTNETFVENAFSFRLLPMGQDASGSFTGTYAPRPNQVIVEISAAVPSPLWITVEGIDEKVTGEKEKAALAKVKSWFKVKDKTGNTVAIKSVDFSQMDKTLKSFVIILDKNLDTTKEYEVTFDLMIKDEEENKTGTIEIDLDRENPVINFISPADFNDKDEDERVIIVEWNKKFNRSLFPGFTASDDRDGNLTQMVYVPEGEFSTLNTNVVGDYKIMLRVEDSWGNVTEETFIFRVEKKGK